LFGQLAFWGLSPLIIVGIKSKAYSDSILYIIMANVTLLLTFYSLSLYVIKKAKNNRNNNRS
jgi:hypothetical protein